VSKAYKGRTVVRDVNLEVAQGEVVGLLGPNGAGKTTTFHIIVGLTRPDQGSVLLGSHNITDLPMYLRAQNGISYLPQEASVFRKLTVEANIMAVLEALPLAHKERRERLENLLEEFGIGHVRKSLADTLSGGERRRVEIARSLVISPKFILLDEPFSGIDPITVIEIQKIVAHLKSRRIGILMTDHNVRETLQVTDRAYIINNGSIFRSGTPQVLGRDPEVKRVYLGEHFSLD
jgi:lipopolysaccharide export system ATP-binding protein